MKCPEHGPTVAAVPWARHAAGHTYAFDEQVAWLATQCSKTAITELMRIAWRTVGAIITRVWADVEAVHDRFAEPARIGIDEISYKRGQRYLTVVVDHDSGRLVWAAPGREKATLGRFFDALGEERCAADHPRQRRRRGLDQRRGRRPMPERGALRRPVPHRQVGHRGPRRRPPPGLERRSRPTRRPQRPDPVVARTHPPRRRRRREGAEARPLRVVEEPREPHQPTAGQAGLDRQDRPHGCTGPTCSRKDSGWSSSSATTKPSRLSRPGSAGPAAAASPPSSTCNAASSNTRPRSSPRSSTACPTDASNRSTPRSASSPASPSASSPPTPSSPWPCSTSAATAPPSPAGDDPRISQESRKSAGRPGHTAASRPPDRFSSTVR